MDRSLTEACRPNAVYVLAQPQPCPSHSAGDALPGWQLAWTCVPRRGLPA